MDATTAITVALIGLVGVLVGGIITTGADWILAVRREKAGADRDRRNRAIEVKRAARMIGTELFVAMAAAQICVKKKYWWSADVPLKTEEWQRYSKVVAPDLSDTEWNAVVAAFMAVETLRTVGDPRPTGAITEALADKIVPILRDIEKGINALAPYM